MRPDRVQLISGKILVKNRFSRVLFLVTINSSTISLMGRQCRSDRQQSSGKHWKPGST